MFGLPEHVRAGWRGHQLQLPIHVVIQSGYPELSKIPSFACGLNQNIAFRASLAAGNSACPVYQLDYFPSSFRQVQWLCGEQCLTLSLVSP